MDMYAGKVNTNNKPQGCYANKVYINPNFNNHPATNNQPLPENNISMHFNPKFSNSLLQKNTSNTRIFINPNFVKSLQGHASKESIKIDQYNVPNNEQNFQPKINMIKNEPRLNVNKSRYSLVRHGTTQEKKNLTEKPSKTIKISKYKSVPISDIKIDITKEHTSATKSHFFNIRKTKTLTQIPKSVAVSGHEYNDKYMKHKSYDINKIVHSKVTIGVMKKINKLKIMSAKKVLKKNNIPCPLFKKYGKCIRNVQNKCEFLHDKKHVSLCRKFLKGICCDTNCLLSHDLTTNKMPTCYFYLRGMCTKVNCPYVHVKLNDNTKICPDFLKGYCEKGNECNNRHITVTGVTRKQSCYIMHKKNDKPIVRKKSICFENRLTTQRQLNINNSNKDENITDGRYYEDKGKWKDNNINGISEVIKPTRCKLGNLPSFIQLHS